MSSYNLTHLKQLEYEAVYVMREVAAQSSGRSCSFRRQGLHRHGPAGAKGLLAREDPFPLMHMTRA